MADERIKNAKVLMVGSGGIGCEVLKTLVLSGFEDIEMIDMDTIETSNLNRQFLFRRHHVGMSKAEVARQAVLRFRPNARITAHHDNVKSPAFGVAFFSRFAVVLNGLDNMEARRHVNRLCLAAGVPLVESGTAGYLGQVSVHIKGVTECFECQPKPTPKTFPVCTIRNTPDKPIHCIVWAKDMLFATLFGPRVVSDLEDAPAVADDGEDAEDAAKETAEELAERTAFFRLRDGEAAPDFAARIYARAFGADIERLLRITDMWAKPGRVPPTPLPPVSAAAAALVGAADAGGRSACAALGLTDAHRLWSGDEAAAVFLVAAARLAARCAADPDTPLLFDKDDALAVEFVASAAALRGMNYNIPGQTLFAAKGMAGNIIHAVATTNAIVGGLLVIEAMKLLRSVPGAPLKLRRGEPGALQCSWLGTEPKGRANALVMPGDPLPPAPRCYVCRRTRLHLSLDLAAWTWGDVLDTVLLPKLGVTQPTVMGPQTTLFEAGDGLEADEVANFAALRGRRLPDLPCGGLRDGDVITVADDTAGEFEVEIKLVQRDTAPGEAPGAFSLEGEVPAAVAAQAPAAAADGAGPSAPPAAAAADDDGFVMVDSDAEEAAAVPAPSAKRKREDDADADALAAKKGKGKAPAAAAAEEDDIIVL